MREALREQLSKEITRKQFITFLAGATLTIFGSDNLLSLLTNLKPHAQSKKLHDPRGFGARKFGV